MASSPSLLCNEALLRPPGCGKQHRASTPIQAVYVCQHEH